jgi:hypothetical protein
LLSPSFFHLLALHCNKPGGSCLTHYWHGGIAGHDNPHFINPIDATIYSLKYGGGEDPWGGFNPNLVKNRGQEDFWAGMTTNTLFGAVSLLVGEGLSATRSLLRASESLEAMEPMTTLYRGVMPRELANIEISDKFINLGNAAGKYFSSTREGVSSYAKQAFYGFGDPPYTMYQTEIPTWIIQPEWMSTVDRNVPAVVVPDRYLPYLRPQKLPTMPVPGKP